MIDKIAKDILIYGYSQDVEKFLEFCVNNNLYHIGKLVGKFFYLIFPTNIILTYTAICCYFCADYISCFDLYKQKLVLSEEDVNNQSACITHIANIHNYYTLYIQPKKRSYPIITFTITTCKRYNLFTQTMNTFLNCCQDKNRIDRWLCVDDNSSEEDRVKMREKYPFMEFYFKTPQEKGHCRSMNIIRNKVDTPYIFHMEDDWKFFTARKYVTNCLDVLGENKLIGQCLLNRNYMETETDRISGGILYNTPSGLPYYVHEHCCNEDEQKKFYCTHGYKPNCAYWPHFSLRPSVARTNTFGPFNDASNHFEQEYALQYRDNGYISAFLEGISCIHIGKLTRDTTGINAYVLNNEPQFYGKMKTYVLNLDRRLDRWTSFQNLYEPKFLRYERFSAVDGNLLQPTEQLQKIFEGNNYNMRAGIVGCALSHIKMYIQLINSNYDSFCILEDDVTFVPHFQNKFYYVRQNLNSDWDICYLGHHPWPQYNECNYVTLTLEKWNTETSLAFSMGGTMAYLISKKGAYKLLRFIDEHGMTNAIDTVQQLSANELNVYYCCPRIVLSTLLDSDIQNNSVSLSIPITNNKGSRLKKDGKYTISDVLIFNP